MLRRSHGSLLAAATWHAWHLKTSLRRFVLRLWLRRCLAENVVYVGDDGARLVGASALPPRRGDKLRLVVVSDTHTYEAALRGVPNGDALVHCGDVLRGGKAEGERHVADLGKWLGAQPHGRKLVLGGNHDRLLESLPRARVADLLGAGVTYVEDEGVVVKGVSLFLSPYSSPNNAASPNRAFQGAKRFDAMRAKLAAFRERGAVDVLVTHGPPAGVLDCGAGSGRLAATVRDLRPRFHLFGHQHNVHGIERVRDTVFVNCSVADGWFAVTRPPVVLDVAVAAARAPRREDVGWRTTTDVLRARVSVAARPPAGKGRLRPAAADAEPLL